ncbi:hypothetical protein, conserved [Trypanosoma brucei brucei TREU927]|uniref:Uncharacterized protein n=1 Tax=Trypanosoma brucei brucei (strain 927/4 GUTat10.1) TaxID=185431 RepID=Q580G5_TRYB2|nr:hypothetical protein, conserved [Trypanosoma brucei brucei TREU927]AAX79794.1 hypothetical protein, conserved [Trypanosoma brucei]AAZ12926.1 hypothetical protein, conserved [Trypanosoma brucei brucei TREU927]
MLRCATSFRCYMRVICLTMAPDGAMTSALRKLDYTPYTLRSAFSQGRANRHPTEWASALRGERDIDLCKLMADFDAAVGPPAAMLYAKLLRECPDYTKVILVKETDKQQWAREHERCVISLLKGHRHPPQNRIAKAFYTILSEMAPHPIEQPLGAISGNGDDDTRISGRVDALERYEAEVCREVPSSRLLVYHHGDGWEPLCSFLGREVPGEPFPPYDGGMHVIRNLHERVERTEKIAYVAVLLLGGTALYAFFPVLLDMKEYFEKLYRDYQIAYGQ